MPVHFGQDPPLIIVPQGPSHRLVVHIGLVLVHPPQPRHRLGIHQFKHPLLPVRPFDIPRTVLPVLQQLQQKLPQISRRTFPAFPFHRARFAYFRLFDFFELARGEAQHVGIVVDAGRRRLDHRRRDGVSYWGRWGRRRREWRGCTVVMVHVLALLHVVLLQQVAVICVGY